MILSTLATFTNSTMGRVRRRTSTEQRSIALVVRSLRHNGCGKSKNVSNSGKSRLGRVAGQIDALGIAFDLALVPPPYAVAQVAHLVYPTALVTSPWIDGFDGRGQTRTAITEHHLELAADQSTLM